MRRMNLYFISIIITLLIMAAALGLVFLSLDDYAESYNEKTLDEIKNTVLGYVSQCYALEGAYPEDLSQLEDDYGLLLNRGKFIYHYELFASNIFPTVKVFAREAGE